MKISFALVIATTLVFLQMPARATAIHPTQRGCRVYDDTSFIGIPGQCGTIALYPRKLYVRSSGPASYRYYPNYYCP
jgi:hypothetical protein